MPPGDQKFRLTASAVASYFSHRCERLFRWNTVESPSRGKPGIGWNVPARVRSHSRPGIALLMEAGDDFELGHLEALGAEGEVRSAGVEERGGRRTVRALPRGELLELLRRRPLPRFVAQPELVLSAEEEARFLARYGLDPGRVKLGPARPDLLEVVEGDPVRLRVWDFKASREARHEHFIQVAFYALVLDHLLEEAGVPGVRADLAHATVRSRRGEESFELAPYRLAVEEFLRNRVPALFRTPAADAHFHVREHCALCEYMETCRAEADAGHDLCRVPFMSSESKRRLRKAGVRDARQLASLGEGGPEALRGRLREASHDLSINLGRYIAAAQALDDGQPRPLDGGTLLMPRYEDVRVVLSAEQDAVTGTCFALGMKTYEGWDDAGKRPLGAERVFVSAGPGREGELLLAFLRELNRLLARVDAENRAVSDRPLDEEEAVAAAARAQAEADAAHAAFRAEVPRLHRGLAGYEELAARRAALAEAAGGAKQAARDARRAAERERRRQQRRLHFYLYDGLDLLALQGIVERHLFDDRTPGLAEEIKNLVRLFPPASVLPDAETFRTVPGTVVTEVLRQTVALPVPYLYDLRTVSERYRPAGADGEAKGYVFRPKYGFGWEHSSQVAFERIHDVWNGEPFNPDPRDPARAMTPEEILRQIEETVRAKLRATDAVVRRLKHDLGERLLLQKEPFRLYSRFDPTDFRMLEALRVFTMLETALEELGVKQLHALPVRDRAAKFECLRGLVYEEGRDEPDGSLWFRFDPASRDAKFEAGDFNLVLTPEDQPEALVGEVDGALFEGAGRRFSPYRVDLLAFDPAADPPRVRLLPRSPDRLRERMDLTKPCTLDRLYVDYNSARVLALLARLQAEPDAARHVHDLAATGGVRGWQPFVADVGRVEEELRARIRTAGGDPDARLNPGQWHAWRGVFREPLTLVWGPPGTGKTHTIAHLLAGYALAAKIERRPIRVLVTAFTHHAVANVLRKTAELAAQYGLGADDVRVLKVGQENAADEELPESAGRVSEAELEGALGGEVACVVAGATVWAVYKAMEKAGGPIRPWFDVVLVDEASQMRVPDALIAFSAAKPGANRILAGDDQQLPPIIHGRYPEEHRHLLGSVFSFMRERMERRKETEADAEERMLFQLEENFRMNEPLTAYPRDVLYRGRFRSTQPSIRIRTLEAGEGRADDPIRAMLDPERPVVLCRYAPPRSFTARNPLEAELAAALAERLGRVLVDEERGELYAPDAFAARGLAVLSPHRAQNGAIRQMLVARGFGTEARPLPLVDTVEKLQGKERDVVLVSYGVADEEYADAEAEFLLGRNRFNVAATRARRKLIVLCSDAVLDVVPADRDVLLESMMLKEFRRYCSDGELRLSWRCPPFGRVPLTIQWKGFDR